MPAVPHVASRAACRGPACGGDGSKIAAIDDESSDLLSARERAAIRFTEKLAVDHHKVDDALWAEMRRHFSEAEIIELVAHTTL